MDKSKPGICRVCLAKSKTMYVSIYEKYKDWCISDYINAIADVKICVNDGLPDRICSSCLVELEQAVQFKQKCESSHHILTSTFSVNKIEDEIDIKDNIVKEEEPDCYDKYDDCENNEDLKVNDMSEIKKSRAIDLHLQCDDCKEFFKSKCKLQVHWKKIHFYEALKCPECKRMFKSFKAFKSHKIKKPQSCKYASKYRIEGEGKKRLFYCKECTYNTKRIKDMITHIITHTGERPFKCQICFKTFTQQAGVQIHQEYSHPELFKEERPCHICGKLIKGRSKMYLHLRTHSKIKWTCLICSKKYKSKFSLRTHMKIHGVKSYTCKICEKDYFTKASLANHRRIVHEKRIKIYKCDICDYSSKIELILAKHKVKHNDTNISCSVCGMFFESKKKFARHQRYHFEKMFECMYCDKKFSRKDNVQVHIKNKHKFCGTEQNDKALEEKSKHYVKVSKQVIESKSKDCL